MVCRHNSFCEELKLSEMCLQLVYSFHRLKILTVSRETLMEFTKRLHSIQGLALKRLQLTYPVTVARIALAEES